MIGLLGSKKYKKQSLNISTVSKEMDAIDCDNNVKDREWFKLEPNPIAIEMVTSMFPSYSEEGLRDEIIAFLTVYMLYLETRDDKYLSYFICTAEVREFVERIVYGSRARVNYSSVEYKGFAIVGANRVDNSFTINTEVAVFSLDVGSLSVGGKPLSIGVQKVYSIDYTVYNETYKCCLDCNCVLDDDSCDCGGSNIRVLNKKLVSKIAEKKGE